MSSSGVNNGHYAQWEWIPEDEVANLWINLKGMAYRNNKINPKDIGPVKVVSIRRGPQRVGLEYNGSIASPSAAELSISRDSCTGVVVGVAPRKARTYNKNWRPPRRPDSHYYTNNGFKSYLIIETDVRDCRVAAKLVRDDAPSFYSLVDPRDDGVCHTTGATMDHVFFPARLRGQYLGDYFDRRRACSKLVQDFIRDSFLNAGAELKSTDKQCGSGAFEPPQQLDQAFSMADSGPSKDRATRKKGHFILDSASNCATVDTDNVQDEDRLKDDAMRHLLDTMLRLWPDLTERPGSEGGLNVDIVQTLVHGILNNGEGKLILLANRSIVTEFCSKLPKFRVMIHNIDFEKSGLQNIVFQDVLSSYDALQDQKAVVDDGSDQSQIVGALRNVLYAMIGGNDQFGLQRLTAELRMLMEGVRSSS